MTKRIRGAKCLCLTKLRAQFILFAAIALSVWISTTAGTGDVFDVQGLETWSTLNCVQFLDTDDSTHHVLIPIPSQFPASQKMHGLSERPKSNPGHFPRMKVLLIEDDPIAREFLTEWLLEKNFHVIAEDDVRVLDLLLVCRTVDVIVSDIYLPRDHKLEWLDSVSKEYPGLPVVLVTGRPDLATAVKAVNHNVVAYLLKPPNLDELESTLRRLCHTKVLMERIHGVLSRVGSRDAFGINDSPEIALLVKEWYLRAGGDRRAENDPREEALREAVQVLEKTKGSFKSKELGALRKRLEALLEQGK